MTLPERSVEYTLYIPLRAADDNGFVTDPTIATGDFEVRTGDGDFVDITTLPAADPAGTKNVKIVVSVDEMDADNGKVVVLGSSSINEWLDIHIFIDLDEQTVRWQ